MSESIKRKSLSDEAVEKCPGAAGQVPVLLDVVLVVIVSINQVCTWYLYSLQNGILQ